MTRIAQRAPVLDGGESPPEWMDEKEVEKTWFRRTEPFTDNGLVRRTNERAGKLKFPGKPKVENFWGAEGGTRNKQASGGAPPALTERLSVKRTPLDSLVRNQLWTRPCPGNSRNSAPGRTRRFRSQISPRC